MRAPRKLRVYIVEDSRTQADIARALLEKAGHAVIVNQLQRRRAPGHPGPAA